MTIGEILNIDERQVASGTIDTDVITDKMSDLQENDPDLYDEVVEQYPQLDIIPTAMNVQETATTTITEASGIISEAKNTAEGFTPVLMFSALPKLASEKGSQAIGEIKTKAEETVTQKIIGAILNQTIL